MRTLKARQISTGSWLQRIDTGGKNEDDFHSHVVNQFSLALGDVQVIIGQATPAEYSVIVAELSAGSHLGEAVIAAPASIKTDEMRRKSASKVILTGAQGSNVGTMPPPQLTQMMIAMGQQMGIVDDNGDVI